MYISFNSNCCMLQHSRYGSNGLSNDIALLQLSSSVSMNSYVSTIELDDGSYGPGSSCVITGWGYMEVNGCEWGFQSSWRLLTHHGLGTHRGQRM